ncbi:MULTISPECIES: ABC transporter ATP-binding protein [unclassified Mesorhizobium]|uniref:dipeptide ABC transporter ATP-binding protein n=1 Tax=unclassified Mesorhizobium TaxID=325217 RepID=UPI00095FF227|nr:MULTISPECIES: ABC transporter ATP-binding protein [unclassified Mesorhizobium]MBN9275849.1 ABC transporter ATP-binding protein [Mesorhizobium sp.]OJX82870.1 MAG: peptide ABC transporter ATP-binding protein [Mesorhizobium sp. 65-26]
MTDDPAQSPEFPVLSIDNLGVWYKGDNGWHTAARGVSMTLARGEALGLVGESGSGKSSVAMGILRYLPRGAVAAADRLLFEGRDLAAMSLRELRRLRGSRMSAVYQHPGAALNPTIRIGQQMAETIEEHGTVDHRQALRRAAELLERMHVRDPEAVLERYPHQLSGGMQQRVTIAMAIALEPSLLVLDEPTTALDATVQSEIVGILNDLRRDRDMSILLISHDIGLVRRVADRALVMRHGTVVEQGDVEAIFDRPQHPYTVELVDSAKGVGIAKRDGHRLGPQSGQPGESPTVGDLSEVWPPSLRDRNARLKNPVAIRCRNLSHRIGSNTILSDISLDVPTGSTFALIGESGSGKSTLAKIITGLQKPVSGTLELMGRAVSGLAERREREDRRAIQMVYQSPDMTLNPSHRLRGILALPLRRLVGLRGSALGMAAEKLIQAVKLPADYVMRRPRALSGGQRQRVAIARAFAGAPQIIVLDEPTSALDVSVQSSVLNLLNDLQRQNGTTYLFISHDLNVVRHMADYVGVLYRGRLVEVGPADNVFAGPNHPYTRMLLSAGSEAPVHSRTPAQAIASPSEAGCVFAARCPVMLPRCANEAPPTPTTAESRPNHVIACWHSAA